VRVMRQGRVSRGVHICLCLHEAHQSVGAARDRDDSGRRARYGGWQARCREVCTLGTMRWHDCCLWVSCSTTPEDPFAQETVPMARSPALTLLDVIQAVSEVATNEQETLATMVHLLTSGQVRLSDEAISGIKALFVTTNVAA
jgi:hypothetical protein